MKKRYISTVLVVICILLVPVVGTAAYFTQAETAHSVITTGNVSIELQEFTDQKDQEGKLLPFASPVKVMPGENVSKIVQVKNRGSGEAWVRIALTPEFKLSSQHGQEKFQPDTDMVTLHINRQDWEMGEDNFLYYKKPLKEGETTSPALRSLTFSGSMGSEYQNSSFVLDVQAQAVQVKNNGETALTAAGWPEMPAV